MREILITLLNVASDDAWQAKALIVVFSLLGLFCLVCSIWNPYQLIFVVICASMVVRGYLELKQIK